MVLVDGGVLENIPVDAVRNMGADLVIAVALETNRPSPDQIKTLPDVMRQTIALTIVKNEQRSEAKADLVISVEYQTLFRKRLPPMERDRRCGIRGCQGSRIPIGPIRSLT